jgi:hypothetical protein
VVRQRAAADAMELTAKIARYNPKFDRGEFDQNILIRPVVVGRWPAIALRRRPSRILGTVAAPSICRARSEHSLSFNEFSCSSSTIPARRVDTRIRGRVRRNMLWYRTDGGNLARYAHSPRSPTRAGPREARRPEFDADNLIQERPMPAGLKLLAAMAGILMAMGTANAQPNPQPGTSTAAPAGPSSQPGTVGLGGEPQVIDHTAGPARPSHADPGRTTNEGAPGSESTPGSAGQGNVHEPHLGAPK